ncbi:glycosyltransferase family 87 protein [Rhodococcoides trifolii]|uniref:glycosyltransferase family 87 protein n=1 Tax=Rhodococcoides trifolii TaxID=908250 RepID=UPI001E59BD9D|nr:glycosyltransferase family 87 protein [Rhodococcus trifolii]
MSFRSLEPRTADTAARVISYVMWPIAVMTVLNRVLVKAVNGFRTDDFTPVYQAALAFLNRRPVYDANFSSVDPHYLYPPSGTLMIAPLAVIDPERSRWLFISINAIAAVVALYLLLKLFDVALSSPITPVVLFAAFSTETVTNTLVFTNINGLVLLGEVAFLGLLLKKKPYWSGAAIGLTIAVKPTLAPLLLLPLVRKEWRVFVTAIGIPLVLTAVAIPLIVDPWDFVRRTVPYLGETRDYFNSSIAGNALYYGLPEWLSVGLRGVFAIIVVATLYLLWKYYRHDELFFLMTASGVLLTASWLLSSLAQMYYSMMLFPFLLTVLLRNSTIRNWPAWLAAYGFLSYDSWLSGRWPTAGRAAEYMKTTFGWSLLLIVVLCVLVGRYLAAKREGRLDGGIDPVFDDARTPSPALETKVAEKY